MSKNKPSFSRIQFDAAHELGHILLHPKSEDIEAISREEFKFLEKQANEFAASFLLPKEAFIKISVQFRLLCQIKEKVECFNISDDYSCI